MVGVLRHRRRARRSIASFRRAIPVARGGSAYTYLHLPIIAGVIVCAVADELVLMHPDHVTEAGVVVILGGPFIYLFGNALFKWVTNDRRTPPLSHLAGVAALAMLTPLALAHWFSALSLSTLTTVVLIVVAVWESLALRRKQDSKAVRND